MINGHIRFRNKDKNLSNLFDMEYIWIFQIRNPEVFIWRIWYHIYCNKALS